MCGYGGFMGMQFFWWAFWLVALVVFFVLVRPALWRQAAGPRESPLEILGRRYASGDLSTDEYLERKARLQGLAPPSGPPPPARTGPPGDAKA